MGRLWDLVEQHRDVQPYRPSERAIARRIGVSPTALARWRDPAALPEPGNLRAAARALGVDYEIVLDAALHDAGYLTEGEYR